MRAARDALLWETAGSHDVELAIEALTAFYNANICIDGSDAIELA